MDWRTFLIIGHILGTILGVGGATFAEIFLIKSLKDGKIDDTESSFLKTTYTVLRIGMVLLVLSGFGLLLLTRISGQEEHLYSPRLWTKLIVTVVILVNALLIQTRRIPMWLGASLSLTSWYVAFIVGAWRVDLSLGTLLVVYGIAVAAVALILNGIKKTLGKPHD